LACVSGQNFGRADAPPPQPVKRHSSWGDDKKFDDYAKPKEVKRHASWGDDVKVLDGPGPGGKQPTQYKVTVGDGGGEPWKKGFNDQRGPRVKAGPALEHSWAEEKAIQRGKQTWRKGYLQGTRTGFSSPLPQDGPYEKVGLEKKLSPKSMDEVNDLAKRAYVKRYEAGVKEIGWDTAMRKGTKALEAEAAEAFSKAYAKAGAELAGGPITDVRALDKEIKFARETFVAKDMPEIKAKAFTKAKLSKELAGKSYIVEDLHAFRSTVEDMARMPYSAGHLQGQGGDMASKSREMQQESFKRFLGSKRDPSEEIVRLQKEMLEACGPGGSARGLLAVSCSLEKRSKMAKKLEAAKARKRRLDAEFKSYQKKQMSLARQKAPVKKAAKRVAAGSKKVASKSLKVAGATAKGVMRVVNPLGIALAVGQAGKILSESVADKIEFERKLKLGEYDETLAKRLKYATVDALLGRGTGEAIHKACSNKGSYAANTKSCLSGAWQVGKQLKDLGVSAAKAVGRGSKNCALAAFSKKHECHLGKKETWVKAGKMVSKGVGAIGSWFSKQYKTHRKNYQENSKKRAWCKKNKEKCAEKKKLENANKKRAHAEYAKRQKAEQKKIDEANRKRLEKEKAEKQAAKKEKRAAAKALREARRKRLRGDKKKKEKKTEKELAAQAFRDARQGYQ
jgi:hypothetical protein